MKEIFVRSIFGLLFLCVVFVPYVYDLQNDKNIMNLVFYLFALLGTHEFFLMSSKGPKPSTLKAPALLLVTALFLPTLLQTYTQFLTPIPSPIWEWIQNSPLILGLWFTFVLSAVLFIVLIYRKDGILVLFENTFLSVLFYPVLPLLVLSLCYTVSDVTLKLYLLLVLIPIYLNDTLAYVTGRLIGKTPLFPSVSPKKTWQGFFGGLIGALIVMEALNYFKGPNTTQSYIIFGFTSVMASVLATYGDLFESKLKRAVGIKDSGTLIPGHGGILDRIDAMLFVAPILYLLLILIDK